MGKDIEKDTVTGVVTEALPNTLFRVKISDDKAMLAYLSGRMRINRIRVLVGDTVLVELDPYGGKGRIIKRG
ncbi:MAG: translation initiation factor IF-1 [Candidatus Taylorbacteria bacterium RIFCSPHIGHO2_02_FULL_46_13]|uniref:Translation initiation factor IF-1 n=1 Tax=Candidatus Taylorbacteria bacterium RIFCSPHIGHO2_02_FULL_46_13 TaxID=1802312 RepID=A0A1G2MTS3_9BACT|nr:MAG: translation initiation factor IF-1 [Candidatus Taylorbacteria bacterium RIFCSPHIGHO2_02_FULL_46_13]